MVEKPGGSFFFSQMLVVTTISTMDDISFESMTILAYLDAMQIVLCASHEAMRRRQKSPQCFFK